MHEEKLIESVIKNTEREKERRLKNLTKELKRRFEIYSKQYPLLMQAKCDYLTLFRLFANDPANEDGLELPKEIIEQIIRRHSNRLNANRSGLEENIIYGFDKWEVYSALFYNLPQILQNLIKSLVGGNDFLSSRGQEAFETELDRNFNKDLLLSVISACIACIFYLFKNLQVERVSGQSEYIILTFVFVSLLNRQTIYRILAVLAEQEQKKALFSDLAKKYEQQLDIKNKK